MKTRVSRVVLVLAIALGLSLAAAHARAQAYKWKDASGHIHFTENYYEIPEKYRKNIETREMPTRAGDPSAAGEEPDTNEVALQDGVRTMSGRDLTIAQQERLDAWFKAWGTMWIVVGGIALLANVIIQLGLVAHAFINGHVGWGIANFFIGISTPVYLMVHVEQSMGVRLGMLALYLSPAIVFGVVLSQLVGVLA